MSRRLKLKVLTVDIPSTTEKQQCTNERILAAWVRISGFGGNTNGIFVGDVNVSATNGFELNPRESIAYSASNKGDFTEGPWFDLRDFYFATDTAGNDAVVEYYEVD